MNEYRVGFLGERAGPGVIQYVGSRGGFRSDYTLADAVDPAVVGFNVGLHGVDAEGFQAISRGGQKGFNGVVLAVDIEVRGVVADEEAFS